MMARRWVILILLFTGIAGVGTYIFSRPCLYVKTGDLVLIENFTQPGDTFSLQFIHSVEKTPVTENFVVTASGQLRLQSTVYQSFGVGLPFLASDGTFIIAGDHFIMENMARQYSLISLRTGPEARLTLYYRGQVWPLYRDLPAGSQIDIYIGPFYDRWRHSTSRRG